ncbi:MULTISPECIES: hypothetical protein [Methylosinus]|uniref:Uncharacterized protein n=1 Tax=Methylosinus trichosporium (strain ATCC 35070 / NCIMB 11131 / UNIQEM 75 / OB3b) TaxID=595536 RepID=A0A2D2D473_METT3|nr:MULTISPECIES: hypothetical protein [Methylosinus]ATQ69754.1 hypothetical protein CQW49_19095 [Methylosinus trichosporium OB3b]OBS52447.1 hypothetical protein A8B73_11365 [Methylosinus sp. 3S-1]
MSDALADCLGRMERLIETLDETRDAQARALARALLDACLDLHGLALARMLTLASGAEDGRLLAAFAADHYVASALLLHGLHPDEPETRLRRAISGLREKWGATIELIDVSRAIARVSVRLPEDQEDRADARREIERSLTEAAPDLDRIVIEERATARSLAE